MVGVPGRSKGCATCRRRRKGCDLQRPVCGQCKTANITCEGWQRDRVFVNAGLGESSASAVARYTPSAATTSPPKILMEDSLVRTAYGEKYLELFWDMYLPDGWSLDNKTLSDFSVGTWTTLARNIYQNEPAVKVALLAHCFATVGTRDNKKWMVDQSLKMYVTALGNVRAGLYHRTKWRSDSLVVASRGLASYEILYGQETGSSNASQHTQAKSWHSHNLGDEALIIQRTPWAHVEGDGHRLFIDGRMQLIISACMRRKRSFLSEPMWMTIPWTKQPKTPKDRLLDVLAKVPTILEDVDTLASAPHFDGFIPLLQLCQEVDKGLSSWLAIHAPLQHYEEIRAQGFEDPTAEDLVVAEAMGLCWSGYVYTHLSIRQALKLVPHLAGGSDPVVAALEFSERTDPRTYYGLILEIAPIFFKPSAKTMFSKACAFSMGVAMGSALISEGPESELCQQLLSIFTASDEAIKMGKFLQSTIKDFPPLMVGTC